MFEHCFSLTSRQNRFQQMLFTYLGPTVILILFTRWRFLDASFEANASPDPDSVSLTGPSWGPWSFHGFLGCSRPRAQTHVRDSAVRRRFPDGGRSPRAGARMSETVGWFGLEERRLPKVHGDVVASLVGPEDFGIFFVGADPDVFLLPVLADAMGRVEGAEDQDCVRMILLTLDQVIVDPLRSDLVTGIVGTLDEVGDVVVHDEGLFAVTEK